MPGAVRALWGSSHPGPSVVVTVLALALGLAAHLSPDRLAMLTAAVLAGQLSVGISNDAIDASRDRAVGRVDKPIARGDVSLRVAWSAAVGLVIVSLVLSLLLSPAMAVIHAVALASAWAYNAGVKNTAWSVAPFRVSFGLFPSLATLSAEPPAFAASWATVAGAALGAAVHLTNVLPDLDDDARTGIRGLPHRLGARASVILAAAGVLVGGVSVLGGPWVADAATPGPVAWCFFAAVVAVAVWSLVRALLRPPSRVLFRLTMLAALLLATQLVLTSAA